MEGVAVADAQKPDKSHVSPISLER